MRAFLAVLAAVAGLVAGYAAGFAVLYPFFTQVMGYHDRDGGIAMGVAFFFAPIVAVVCAIVAAVIVLRKTGGPRQRRATGEELTGGAEKTRSFANWAADRDAQKRDTAGEP